VAFANMVGPGGTVHAYEPQRRLFQMLSGNVALNALERVYCHQAAVGDAMGEIDLPPLPSPDTHFNFSAVSLMQSDKSGDRVPLVTLDSLELDACAAVKIDVEGMESLVLAGARRLIERCRPVIYVENNDQDTSARLAKMLPELDYAGFWSIHPYYDARNFYSNTVDVWANVVWASNLICAPRNSSFDPQGAQPFLGAEDNWHACVQRMQGK
jgi:FkbM family methyltransferase